MESNNANTDTAAAAAKTGSGDTPRKVAISDSDRRAWSSDAPRQVRGRGHGRSGSTPLPPRVDRTRCRVLEPNPEISYPRSCLVLLTGPSGSGKLEWAQRLFPAGAIVSQEQVRELVAVKAAPEDVEAKTTQLLHAVARKRLGDRKTVVVDVDALTPDTRQEFVLIAQEQERTTHLVVFDVSKQACVDAQEGKQQPVAEEIIERQIRELADTRKRIHDRQMGDEGLSSVLTLTRGVAARVGSVVLGRVVPQD